MNEAQDPLTAVSEFGEELASHLDDLLRRALRLTGNTSDAQDLRSETIMRALRFYDKFQPGTNMRAWLRRIMMNTFINNFRRKQRFQKAEEKYIRDPDAVRGNILSEGSFRMSNFDGVADTTMDDRISMADEMEHALKSLSDEFRIAIELVDIEGFSYAETAAVMDTPVGTVMSRIYRARKKLRKALGEYAKEIGLAKEAA